MKNLIKAFTFFTIASFEVFASESKEFNRFDWNNISLQLPFPIEWAVQKPRTKPKDPLNFMDATTPPPRIIGNLTETNFELASNDFSDFKQEFINSKNQWVKKSGGTITENPIVSFDSKLSLFRYEYSFSVPQGNFREFGHFQRCQSKTSYSLRVMIPEKEFKNPNADAAKIIEWFRKKSACIH